jgi:myo-inositol-1(or 4)-monophosphatase
MHSQVKAEDLRRVLEHAAGLVRAVKIDRLDVDVKGDGSPVTALDRQLDGYLKGALSELMPSAGWLSEETADDRQRLEREWVWVVDPLDGTRDFVKGRPECAISIGLVRDGRPVAGGVLNPVTGEGAVTDEAGRIESWGLSAQPPAASLDDAVAVVSRSEVRDGVIGPYAALVKELRPLGSVAYKLLRVAGGADHLTFSVVPKSEWDVCGGLALLEAAGLAYVRFDGRVQRFNQPDTKIACGAVAGPAPLVEAFMGRLGQVRKQ